MALTKDKLTAHLQTQIGMTKPESRQIVESLFEIMKETLTLGQRWAIQFCGVEQFASIWRSCARWSGSPRLPGKKSGNAPQVKRLALLNRERNRERPG